MLNVNQTAEKFYVLGSLHIKEHNTNFIWHNSYTEYAQINSNNSICGLFEISYQGALYALCLCHSPIAKIRTWDILVKYSSAKVFASKHEILNPKINFINRVPFDALPQMNLLNNTLIRTVDASVYNCILCEYLYPNFKIDPKTINPTVLDTRDVFMMDVDYKNYA